MIAGKKRQHAASVQAAEQRALDGRGVRYLFGDERPLGWQQLAALRGNEAKIKFYIKHGWLSSRSEVPLGVLMANVTKQRSASVMPDFRLWYRDTEFTCKLCGTKEIWTALQQQWWYEVAGGEIESTAVNCSACRRAKKARAALDETRRRAAALERAQRKASGKLSDSTGSL